MNFGFSAWGELTIVRQAVREDAEREKSFCFGKEGGWESFGVRVIGVCLYYLVGTFMVLTGLFVARLIFVWLFEFTEKIILSNIS